MTDSDLRQLRQNLMAQFQEMMDEDVLELPDGFMDDFGSVPWK
jgi:hypothetical protein